MANINGENYAKAYVNAIQEQANAGEYGGSVKVLFDRVAAGAGADVMFIGKLPKGARILRVSNVGGNNPTFNVAPGALLSAETTVTATLGAAPTFPVSAWVEYTIV